MDFFYIKDQHIKRNKDKKKRLEERNVWKKFDSNKISSHDPN